MGSAGLVGPAGAAGTVGGVVRVGLAPRVAFVVGIFDAAAVLGGGAVVFSVRPDVGPPGRDGSGFRAAPDGCAVPDHSVPPVGGVAGIAVAGIAVAGIAVAGIAVGGNVGAPDGGTCPAAVVTVNGSDPLLP
jgi:hypothetical protein